MKLTNKLNLPLPLVKAIANDSYNKGDSDYTATSLIEPARIGALKAIHAADLEEDVSDRIYSLLGQAEHTILERAAKELKEEGYIAEERFYATIAGKRISAQIDVYHPKDGLLQDYKLTSVYKVKDGATEEYAQQLNIQAELLRQNGHNPKSLQIVAILRDWNKGEYERELQAAKVRGFNTTKYPGQQVVILDVPLVSSEDVTAFLLARLQAHQDARKGPLPECSKEERWATEDTYAIMKKGGKKATKLFDTEDAANTALNLLKDSGEYTVEKRPGRARRCESYCPVKAFCEQAKKLGVK